MRPDEDMKELAGQFNITSNSTIQTDESCVINEKLSSWSYPGTIPFGMIHDSVSFYVHKDCIREVLPKLRSHFEANDPWQRGLRVPIDIEVVDYEDSSQYFKNGISDEEFLRRE